ncbi:MAG: TetR/AcrR family transcriptional regulator [Spirochaetales bacterium]|nr:TetR/AcrR family transcriptional regulator [Spirochaetales bacterium]
MKPKLDPSVIYEAALEIFARYGYGKATLEDIAGRLNMTKGSLYNYTTSKLELYRQTVTYAFTRWQDKVAAAVRREEAPDRQLEVLCDCAVGYLKEDSLFREILKQDPEIFPMFPSDDPYREINDRSRGMIADILSRGIGRGIFNPMDVDKTADILFSIYKMFIIQAYVKTNEEYIPRMLRETLDLLTRGLYKRGDSPE